MASGRGSPSRALFDNGNVIEDAAEQEILGRILDLRGEGLGARRIAGFLNDAGIKNPRTRRWWTHGTVGDLLRTAVRNGRAGGLGVEAD